jgi:putative ABC transport system permease protein
MSTLLQDLKYGFRVLARNPGFTAVAILTIALGIGANTAIFSVVNAVLLRPLPYPQADRLEQVMRHYPVGNSAAVSATKFVFWKQHNRVFSGLAAYNIISAGFNLTGDGQPEHITGIRVSTDFFRVLGVPPALGRDFNEEEERPGGPNVAIISNALWRQRFGGDPSTIGRVISLSGTPYNVVGVMPAGFESNPAAEVWLPLSPVLNPQERSNLFLVLGRLRPGITSERAQADMARTGEEFRRQYPNLIDKTESVAVMNYQRSLVGDARPALLVLMGAVGLVLLIACANVANLLLARAIGRSKEFAVRTAMGADRSRLVWQLLTESVILGLAGGGIGLLLCEWGMRGMLGLVPESLPQIARAGIDTTTLAFTVLIALAAALLFGLAPAFQISQVSLTDSLREGGGRATGGVRHDRLRSLLVVGEFALSLVLLASAALLIETFINLGGVNPGFDPQNVLTMKVSLVDSKYNATSTVTQFFRQVLDRTRATPGVASAAFVNSLPMELAPDLPFQIAGRKDNSSGDAEWRMITPNYFSAMRIPLLQGRTFKEGDNAHSAGVVMINQVLAKEFFPNQNPIGQHLTIGGGMGPEFADEGREILGVVGDTKEEGLSNPARATVFIPWAQLPDPLNRLGNQLMSPCLVVQTRVSPMSLSGIIAKQVLDADATQPVFQIQSLATIVGGSIARQHFDMILLEIFAALALLLASIGIYGVISHAVTQRTHEIGIRMALGAQKSDVLKMVMRQGFKLVLMGVGIGIVGALALTSFMASLLYGVKPTDPLTFIAVSLVLIAVALAACYIPARRAAKVDPMVALRYE